MGRPLCDQTSYLSGWWFGTRLVFFHIGIIIPTDFHIFQRGRNTTNQIYFSFLLYFLLFFYPSIFLSFYLSILLSFYRHRIRLPYQNCSPITIFQLYPSVCICIYPIISNYIRIVYSLYLLMAIFIELDDGKFYRKPLYLMVKTMVSCRFSLKPIH